jgi:hypothetical protein
LLTAVDAKNYPLALGLAQLLAQGVQTGTIARLDLPTIPYHYYSFYAECQLEPEPVIRKLELLKQNTDDPENINLLLSHYHLMAQQRV